MINLLAGLVTGRCLCTKLIAEMNDVIDSGAYFRLDKCVKKSANMSRDTGKMWIIPSSLAKLIKWHQGLWYACLDCSASDAFNNNEKEFIPVVVAFSVWLLATSPPPVHVPRIDASESGRGHHIKCLISLPHALHLPLYYIVSSAVLALELKSWLAVPLKSDWTERVPKPNNLCVRLIFCSLVSRPMSL